MTAKIAKRFEISGPFNIQFLVRDSDVKVSRHESSLVLSQALTFSIDIFQIQIHSSH